jgi:hypothetical protein
MSSRESHRADEFGLTLAFLLVHYAQATVFAQGQRKFSEFVIVDAGLDWRFSVSVAIGTAGKR